MLTRQTPRIPSYRLHKPSGRAVVTLSGKDFYLGPWGTQESKQAYERLISEWLQRKSRPSSPLEKSNLTVSELILAYWKFAEGYYKRSDGTPTGEMHAIRDSLRPLRKLYGRTLAREFGPKCLKVVRQEMIKSGICRTLINRRVSTIKRVFKWGVSNELVPSNVFHSLQSVEGLKRGRCEVRESDPVLPVPEKDVEAIYPFVSPQVKAMIQLQLLTAMRPGEVVIMRTCDLDMSSPVWIYTPQYHKTQHHGHPRQIFLGPKAQEVLKQFHSLDRNEYLFSPADARAWLYARKHELRKTPMTPSQRARKQKKNPGRAPRERYDVDSYRRAISYGIKKAGVQHWHPNQLRHTAATNLRKQYGLQAAAAILSHNLLETTQIYAEVNTELALHTMSQIG